MTKRDPRTTAGRDDARAFEDAMGDARKLTGPQRVRLAPAPPRAGAPHKRGVAQSASPRAESAASPFTIEQDGEAWTARANGIDRAFLKKLSTGKIAIEAKLDLHGQTKRQALHALERFLSTADVAGARALLLVHGRGLHSGDQGPTLRDTARDFVTRGAFAARLLAATSAPPSLGGAGATLLWLRRSGG
jgi:DNA-nicking Smr family endonuclease